MSVGIKETKEVLLFSKVLAVFVAERLKDGAGVDDLVALVTKAVSDPAFLASANAAITDAGAIPGELSDLDGAEIKELGHLGIDIVADVISALKAA